MKKTDTFLIGLRDGLPIGLGYFAVAFSMGILARNAGLNAVEGFFSSFFTRASSGEFGVYTLIAAGTTVFEVILLSVVANMRYLLMGASLSQKLDPDMPLWKRIICGCCITDEIFGISTSYRGTLPLSYPLGAMLIAGSMWASGTALGIVIGNILPENIVAALSVALYGMFIAVIIPPGKKDRNVGIAIIASFLISWLFSILPYLCEIRQGLKITLLTIIIASAAAIIKPVPDEAD